MKIHYTTLGYSTPNYNDLMKYFTEGGFQFYFYKKYSINGVVLYHKFFTYYHIF
jgi:hypothetical protein